MAACEKCWSDAYLISIHSGKSQSECYFDLLESRKNNPCTEQEQSGQYWDNEKKCDKRIYKEIDK